MTRRLLVGAIVAGALTVTAGTALALSSNDQPTTTASAPTSTTTPETTSSTSSTSPTSSTAGSPTSSSTSSAPSSSGTTSPAPAQLSADDASRLVRERMGGTVHEVEREVEHGRAEWKIEVTGRDGVTYDVRVDAVTGDFTRIEQDDRDGRGDSSDDSGDDHGRHGGDDDRHGGDDDRHGGDDDRHGGGDDHGDDD